MYNLSVVYNWRVFLWVLLTTVQLVGCYSAPNKGVGLGALPGPRHISRHTLGALLATEADKEQ